MFGIPGKQAVSLTPAAAAQIARLMAKQGSQGLRIGIKKGGCAGMEYTMDYVSEVNPMDEVVEQDGARVMIAPMAQMFLFGTEIDYQVSALEASFRFNNPNVAEACGCGESIKFKDQPAARQRGPSGRKFDMCPAPPFSAASAPAISPPTTGG